MTVAKRRGPSRQRDVDRLASDCRVALPVGDFGTDPVETGLDMLLQRVECLSEGCAVFRGNGAHLLAHVGDEACLSAEPSVPKRAERFGVAHRCDFPVILVVK